MNRYASLLICLFFALAIPFTAGAQDVPHQRGDIIVQLKDGLSAHAWIKGWPATEPRLVVAEQISRPMNLWLLQFDPEQADEYRMLGQVWRQPGLLRAQFNHTVHMRNTTPDDALFNNQWQYVNNGQSGGTPGADLDADLAWDITTGGVTQTGDTIVVAVLDDGIDLNHPDLQQNRWVNWAEIPDNGVDDDNNGYVDDYLGWNVLSNSDNITGGGHGTPVAGIIGADGNNGIGVTGVNWHVKVMIIRNDYVATEAKIFAAYSYALEHRMRYNASGGTEGAFVVATNASFGIDGATPEDSPIWCELFNILGNNGILSCGATANADVNVDVEGDLPTTCPSDFLLSVTNVDHNDVKPTLAGYGATSIDLGAFGSGTYTVANGGLYAGFGGTSGATPHVTGAIALLYSMDCPNLVALTAADPAGAASLVREAILEGVTPNASLNGITVTGGRLNIFNSLNYLMSDCEGCIPPTSPQVTGILDSQVILQWALNDSLQSVDLQWRPVGASTWTVVAGVNSPYLLADLNGCTEYEYQLIGHCSGESTASTAVLSFTTEGCCTAPADPEIFVSPAGIVTISWPAVYAAASYDYRFRLQGNSNWIQFSTPAPIAIITDLPPCTTWEFGLRTDCDTTETAWTETMTFRTLGCGACLEEEYCIPTAFDNSGEYIASVTIPGVIANVSEADPDGYGDYGSLFPLPTVEQGGTYPITLSPGFVDGTFSEVFKVWVDFDQNGSFTSGEVVYTSAQSNTTVTGTIQIPADAPLGLTRMRVVMQFLSATNPCPFQGQNFGEAEDYCLEIVTASTCPAPDNFSLIAVDTSTASITWDPVGQAVAYEVEIRPDGSGTWEGIVFSDNGAELTELTPCTTYEMRVRSTCFVDESISYGFYEFTTDCPSGLDTPARAPDSWRVAPNPFTSEVKLQWLADETGRQQISVHDSFGRLILADQWFVQPGAEVALSATNWPCGVYYLSLTAADGSRTVQRVVKLR
ncbi:MAG: S8 family serine peptidase [Lewinella sp.]|nr:S8 family serine peptidase [Lewinella sp.]